MGLALPPYPQDPPPGWCAKYIGIPHVMGARGPVEFDCWGLMMLVLDREAGFKLPLHDGVLWDKRESRGLTTEVIAAEAVANWTGLEPGEERAFDAIVLQIAAQPLHVGVIAAPGWMLHSSEGADSALERYDGMLWRNRVGAFYRWGVK